jgi:hypothetical protein
VSNRKSRAKRRAYRHRKAALGASGWALARLGERLLRQARHAEAARRERELEVPADPRARAFRERQAALNAAVVEAIWHTKQREERRARQEHERMLREWDEPMTGPAVWSPTSGQ